MQRGGGGQLLLGRLPWLQASWLLQGRGRLPWLQAFWPLQGRGCLPYPRAWQQASWRARVLLQLQAKTDNS